MNFSKSKLSVFFFISFMCTAIAPHCSHPMKVSNHDEVDNFKTTSVVPAKPKVSHGRGVSRLNSKYGFKGS